MTYAHQFVTLLVALPLAALAASDSPTPDSSGHAQTSLTLPASPPANPYDPGLVLGAGPFEAYRLAAQRSSGNPLARVAAPSAPGFFDAIDYADVSMASLKLGIVRLGEPGLGVHPVLAMAYQKDDREDIRRLGIGAGVRWNLTDHLSLGSDLLRFGPESGASPANGAGETVLMGRIECGF